MELPRATAGETLKPETLKPETDRPDVRCSCRRRGNEGQIGHPSNLLHAKPRGARRGWHSVAPRSPGYSVNLHASCLLA